MSPKVTIETSRQACTVSTAEFTQEALEHLAACFVANQLGIDIESPNVRAHMETKILQGGDPKRKICARVRLVETLPNDDGFKAPQNDAQGPDTPDTQGGTDADAKGDQRPA